MAAGEGSDGRGGMRALRMGGYGGPEVLSVEEVALPEPGAGEARVRVRAAAVQIADVALREGHLKEVMPNPALPTTPGWEFAGAVDALGEGAGEAASGGTGGQVDGLEAGEEVVGMTRHFDTNVGAHAEYVVVPLANLAPAPRTVPPVEAAGLPIALTAVQALDLLGLGAGETLLVTGAVGAVGGYAAQLAKLRGAVVVASVGVGDEAEARALGADEVVDREGDLSGQVRALFPGGVDAALNAANAPGALGAVRDGGRYVGTLLPFLEPERGIRPEVVFVQPDGRQLAELVRLVDGGKLRLRTAGSFPLEEAADAYGRVAAGGLRGRVVLVPWGGRA